MTHKLSTDPGRPPRYHFGQQRRRARADFDFIIQRADVGYILKIVDLDLGEMSVTNDIEQVLADIFERQEPPVPEPRAFFILYRDSERLWDRVVLDDRGVREYRPHFQPGPRSPEELEAWGIRGELWTLEPSRKLSTGDDDDEPFKLSL